jgi:glutamate carboxypeptidase
MSLYAFQTAVALSFLLGSAAFCHAQAGAPSAPTEQQMVSSVDSNTAANTALLEKLVDINSGTMHLAGVVAVKDVIAPRIEQLGFRLQWNAMDAITNRAGDLVAGHECPRGAGKCGKRLLLIGHMDTVFEPSSSFQKYSLVPGSGGKVATGPGISDMKGGLVVMLAALAAMKDAGLLEDAEIRIVLDGDEERPGEPMERARRDLVAAAKQSDVALEYEPSSLIDGQDTISIGRRSAITWRVDATGLSGHSSQIFGDKLGYGAVYELTRIVDAFRRELPENGLTFNVGLLLGGTTARVNAEQTGGEATGKSNVIAPAAVASGDIRTLSNEQTERVEQKMRTIVAQHLPKTDARLTFSESYPAMAETPESRQLAHEWSDVSVALGLGPVAEAGVMTRGAGDIAFVASFVPGLVGVGIIGAGMHAEGETAQLDSLPRQAKRNALLMGRLIHTPSGH